MHQQLANPPKYTWSHSVCNFSSGLGVLNEDQLLKSASFGESDSVCAYREDLCPPGFIWSPKITDFLCKPRNDPASIWRETCLTSQLSLHANLLMDFSHRLFGHEKRSSSTCSGLQKTSEKTSAAPGQVWKQMQGFALAFEHSRALLQQVRSQGPPCSQDLNQTTCEMAATSWFYILFLNRII